MTKRFPKKLLLAVAALELLVLTLSHPTRLFSSLTAEPQVNVNFMSIAPALPNATGSTMKPVHHTPAPAINVKGFPARPFTVDDGETIVVEKAPQPVL